MLLKISRYRLIFFITFTFLFLSACSAASNEVNDLVDSGIKDCQNENFNEGILKFEDALKIDPNSYYALISRGWAYRFLSKHQKAKSDFLRCIELAPDQHRAYYELAYLNSYDGYFQKAIQNYLKSIELEPRFFNAYGTLGGLM